MIFILIHFTSCQHYFNFGKLRYSKTMIFFIEPLDIIEIEMMGTTYFNKWKNLDGLYLDIKTISEKGEETEYDTIDKNDYLACINHKLQNNISSYIMKFSNQSPNSLSFALYLKPYSGSNHQQRQLNLSGQYELCWVQDSYLRNHPDDFFIYNVSSNSFIIYPLSGASLFLFYIFGCCSLSKEMKNYEEDEDD